MKTTEASDCYVDCVWNVIAHAQKPDFVFRRNGRVHLNRRGRQFSRLLAAEVCTSTVVMLDTACSKVVWRVLATHSIRQFPLHFPSFASPCAIRFQLDSTAPALSLSEPVKRACRLRITSGCYQYQYSCEQKCFMRGAGYKYTGWGVNGGIFVKGRRHGTSFRTRSIELQ